MRVSKNRLYAWRGYFGAKFFNAGEGYDGGWNQRRVPTRYRKAYDFGFLLGTGASYGKKAYRNTKTGQQYFK